MTILVQQQLRELAQAAPYKHWRAGNYYGVPFRADIEVLVDTPDGLMVVMQGNQNFTAESVAAVAFVGAASPATVLVLLDEIERLTRAAKYCEDIDATHENQRQTMLYDMAVERDQLKAENADLRRDAERYRWLRNKSEFGTRHDPAVYKDGPTDDLDFFHGDELDAAIDQAMTKEHP